MDLGSTAAIDVATAQFLKQISTPGSDRAAVQRAAEVLYHLILAPTMPHLSSYPRIFLSPEGPLQIGEGVFGLRRSFFTAGAETLVTSLWKVADRDTQELMADYYQRLAQGVGRMEALLQTALAMKARHAHPYYWAAFIILGRGDPLRGVRAAP